MIQIQQAFQLQAFNTLHLQAVASHYVKVASVQALQEALDYAGSQQLNVLI